MSIRFQPAPAAESLAVWERSGRSMTLDRLRRIYGETPTTQARIRVDPISEFTLDSGVGTCAQSAVTLSTVHGSWSFTVAAFRPLDRAPKATLVGLNFRGNHTLLADERMAVWREPGFSGTMHYENAESFPPHARGSLAHRWPLEDIVGRGYGLITFCYLQCGPDTRGIFSTGPNALLGGSSMTTRGPLAWGAIGIWSWCLSRLVDLIVDGRLPGSVPSPVVAVGLSRLGKAALWAAAQDTRFAGVISNDSGAMGAALSRDVGETPRLLADVRPYWFARQFSDDLDAGRALPADQWQLLATIAPRILLVGSAADDLPADPEGERLATRRATDAWRLYSDEPSTSSLEATPGLPVGYHLRPGPHDMFPEDWTHYLGSLDAVLHLH